MEFPKPIMSYISNCIALFQTSRIANTYQTGFWIMKIKVSSVFEFIIYLFSKSRFTILQCHIRISGTHASIPFSVVFDIVSKFGI